MQLAPRTFNRGGDRLERTYHIYECEDCILVFAVEQAFDDQALICCPYCNSDKALRDIGSGE